MKHLFFYFALLVSFLVFSVKQLWACDSCGYSLAKMSSEARCTPTSAESPFSFDFTVEQKVWHQRDVALAHELHHQGHDSHDKLREEFYHFGVGADFGSRISLLAELPYVVRHFLEVDNHKILGQRQRTEGFGDLHLNAIYKLLKSENYFAGPLIGIKLPTGKTTEQNKAGDKVEPELQPGSGSFDPSMGAVFQTMFGQFSWHGNALYTIRTRGAQRFTFGDIFSTYLHMDYLLNPESQHFNTRLGIDTTLQKEQRQKDRNGKIVDSGGTTWLLGPEISIQGDSQLSIFGNILFPIYQNLGGIHQLAQYVWNAGVKIAF